MHGLDDAALAGLARASVRASRATPTVRARLLSGIADWLAAEAPEQAPGEAAVSRG